MSPAFQNLAHAKWGGEEELGFMAAVSLLHSNVQLPPSHGAWGSQLGEALRQSLRIMPCQSELVPEQELTRCPPWCAVGQEQVDGRETQDKDVGSQAPESQVNGGKQVWIQVPEDLDKVLRLGLLGLEKMK